MKGTHTSDDVGWFSKAEMASRQWETGNKSLAHDFHRKHFPNHYNDKMGQNNR